ncbi:DUF4817 domain-containing protein [Trichonephila clavipes]|nr:DUF4817 domain-containing protein [Trichonephila clavipes]
MKLIFILESPVKEVNSIGVDQAIRVIEGLSQVASTEDRVVFNYVVYPIKEHPPDTVLISSDEARFLLPGIVNEQSFRYWAAENFQLLQKRPLHSPCVTVWSAVAEFGVQGSYFFEDELMATVTSDRYCHLIEIVLRPKFDQFLGDLEEADIYVPRRRSCCSRFAVFAGHFESYYLDLFLSLQGDITWPPRSPDL